MGCRSAGLQHHRPASKHPTIVSRWPGRISSLGFGRRARGSTDGVPPCGRGTQKAGLEACGHPVAVVGLEVKPWIWAPGREMTHGVVAKCHCRRTRCIGHGGRVGGQASRVLQMGCRCVGDGCDTPLSKRPAIGPRWQGMRSSFGFGRRAWSTTRGMPLCGRALQHTNLEAPGHPATVAWWKVTPWVWATGLGMTDEMPFCGRGWQHATLEAPGHLVTVAG